MWSVKKKIGDAGMTKNSTGMNRLRSIVFFILSMAVLTVPASAHPTPEKQVKVEVTAAVNADKIGMDNVVRYSLSVKGIDNPSSQPLKLRDFKVVHVSHSTEFQFSKGVTSTIWTFKYSLKPKKTGHLTIPPFKYKYQGRIYKTKAVKVQVVKGSVGINDDDFFNPRIRKPKAKSKKIEVELLAEVSRKKVMIGEAIGYRVLLRTRNEYRSYMMLSKKDIPGFRWEEDMQFSGFVPENKESNWGTAIARSVLFPTRSGKIIIPSLKFEIGLTERGVFPLGTGKIIRTSQAITLEVVPQPEAAKGLPIGNFTMLLRAKKKDVFINDLYTFRIQIWAIPGDLNELKIPQFASTEDYTVLPPKVEKKRYFSCQTLQGSVGAEHFISFKRTGDISFPPLELKYYDPGSGKVITLKETPPTIHVTGETEK